MPREQPEKQRWNGFFNIHKPPGPTSHEIVMAVRQRLGLRAVGHTGTLDPLAEGVLVLAVGPATRLAEFVTATEKAYRAEITLGVITETGDGEGRVVAQHSANGVSAAALEETLQSFLGEIEMRPPLFSAVRVGGERLYRLARAGKVIEAPARRVRIYTLRLLSFFPGEEARAVLEIVCSKGTYVRSLAMMIGERLGCGAYLSRLLRIRVGAFTLEQAVSPEEWARDPAAYLIPIREALAELPQLFVDEQTAVRLRQGQAVPWGGKTLPAGPVLVLDQAGEAVGIVEKKENGGLRLQPRKILPRRCKN